jgi:isoleucyl-tRNA synthetase
MSVGPPPAATAYRARAEQDPQGRDQRSHDDDGQGRNYVPGWDCHGLPIEWKIEEENYRAKGKTKPDLSDPAAMIAFRRECRAYAQHWLEVQREEFKRLGVEGDWDHPYTTMSFDAEATIAAELMKFAMNGLLYRGSKPVMWSVVEKTALAEAEVEYAEITSHTIFVKFPIIRATTGNLDPYELLGASIVIWTTTPWTIPGNRSISYSNSISYGLYEVTGAPDGNWAKKGEKFVIADALADNVKAAARIESWNRLNDVKGEMLRYSIAAHPLRGHGYDFDVPLLAGEHVTADTGTGFVHTAPGHGREDFEVWTANERLLADRKINTAIPFTVDADGYFTKDAPGFEASAIDAWGNFGDANGRRCLIDASADRRGAPHISTFLAVEEAGDLPQHAAMVHLHGRRHQWRRHTAQPRPQSHWRDAMGAAARREPHHRHDRDAPRLGGVAPARLGCAHHRLSPQGDRSRDPVARLQHFRRAD